MTDLPIIFSTHAKQQLRKRGATEEEVSLVIQKQLWRGARNERHEAKGNFPHNQEWNSKFYKTKQVNPVFIEQEQTIIVITVYVFYFND